MPSVLRYRRRRDHADQDGRELSQHVAHRGCASLRLGVVRVRRGELLEAGDQAARDEHQDEGLTTRIAAMREPAWIQSTALNDFDDPYLVIHRSLRVVRSGTVA